MIAGPPCTRGKTVVLSGFCKIEQGGGMPVMYVSDTMGVLPAKNIPWRPWMGLVERDQIFGQIHFEFLSLFVI